MKRNKLRVPKIWLLLFMSILWAIAGFNVLKVGIPAFIQSADRPHVYLLISATIFILFMIMFYHTVKKHRDRIMSYENRVCFFKMMNIKGYLFIIGMTTLGIVIKSIEIMPMLFIGTFYIGLGSALSLSALIILAFFIYGLINNE